jgi:undecaprenyl-diphosphatase
MLFNGPWLIDLSVSHFVQSYQPGWLTLFFKMVSFISAPGFYLVVAVPVVLFIFFRRYRWPAIVAALILLGNVLTPVIKIFIGRPRPSADLVHVYLHYATSSFPSGHALGAVLLVGAIWWLATPPHNLRPRWPVYLGVFLFIMLVGYDRIYLGVHWPSDVLAGYLIGLLWLWLIKWSTKLKQIR